MTYVPTSLSAPQEAAIGQRRSAANTTYNVGLANAEFQKGQKTAEYDQGRSNLLKKLQQMRQGLNPAFARRGMMRSGLFNRGLRLGAEQGQQQVGAMDLAQQGVLGQFGISRQQLEAERGTALAGIESERAAQLAQLAQMMVGR